jgi:putative pyruvate formate lyase activating enzyme
MDGCILCPRQCGVDRTERVGYCGSGSLPKVARAAKHHWEEPCISGTEGSGTVFFSGCTLGCVFCQNREISRGGTGREVTVEHLADIFKRLEGQGVHNLNLVTPTHFTPQILQALELAKPTVPVVMNCGGYERVETLRQWEGKVQVYLPDLKYFSPELSAKYSAAPDYFAVASKAIMEMHRQQPQLVWEGDLLKSGLIIRHLVLPGCMKDSLKVLDFLDKNLPKDSFLLSLMSQYTPTENCKQFPEINRRVTTYEYRKVADRAAELGFSGFAQDRRSAKEEYTPPFNLEGV